MEVVFLCGNQENIAVDPVCRAILQNTCKQRLRITAMSSMPATPPAILLVKNSAVLPEDGRFPLGTIPVFDGENRRITAFLQQSGGCGVDYGTSSRATVSLSSMDDSSATVGLQRNLVSAKGRVLEPCEIPVILHRKMSPRQVLSAVAVLLLADVPWEGSYHF